MNKRTKQWLKKIRQKPRSPASGHLPGIGTSSPTGWWRWGKWRGGGEHENNEIEGDSHPRMLSGNLMR